MPASTPVSVHSLRLRGDGVHRDALLASLDDARWPAADNREYLILRQVRVQAPWWQAAERITQDAHTLAAGAVSGWDSLASDALAVRFADMADLLACLSHDLARGRVAGLWYWRNWRHFMDSSPATAIARLWCEQPTRLPDLVAALATHRALPAVCACLDETGLARILDSVRHATGWPLPLPSGDPRPGLATDRPVLPRPRLHDWQPVLQTLPPARLHQLLPLLALTSGWIQLPQLLHEHDHWLDWCSKVGRQLPGATQTPRTRQANQPDERRSTAEPVPAGQATDAALKAIDTDPIGSIAAAATDASTPAPGITAAAETHAPPPATAPAADAERSIVPRHIHEQPQVQRPAPDTSVDGGTAQSSAFAPATADDEDKSGQVPAISTAPSQSDAAVTRTDTPTSESATTKADDSAAFNTTQGGLFYLLNVLAHPAVAPCLQDAPESGWQRLYRLGLHLGLDCDAPLARFLADKLELSDPARLSELAPLRDEARLCQLADRHYAHLDAWGPALLAVPAQANFGRSHLDLYYPLSAVRLEVRRAGLDVDPGWLPWLGQVVHFHYRQTIPPAGDMP